MNVMSALAFELGKESKCKTITLRIFLSKNLLKLYLFILAYFSETYFVILHAYTIGQ